jgi:hypothetical protein
MKRSERRRRKSTAADERGGDDDGEGEDRREREVDGRRMKISASRSFLCHLHVPENDCAKPCLDRVGEKLRRHIILGRQFHQAKLHGHTRSAAAAETKSSMPQFV